MGGFEDKRRIRRVWGGGGGSMVVLGIARTLGLLGTYSGSTKALGE